MQGSNFPMNCTTSPCSSPSRLFPQNNATFSKCWCCYQSLKCQRGSCRAMSRGTVPRCGRGTASARAGAAGDMQGQSSHRSRAGTAWPPGRAELRGNGTLCHSLRQLFGNHRSEAEHKMPKVVNAHKITICGYFSRPVSGQLLQITDCLSKDQ